MEASGEACIDSLALDLSTILTPDSSFLNAKQHLDDTIEQMMVRLEEFSTLIEMMSECCGSAVGESVPRAFLARQQLHQLFGRIDAMSSFVELVEAQLQELENTVDTCEKRLDGGRWSSALSSLFHVRNLFLSLPERLQLRRGEADSRNAVMPVPTAEIFNTEQYFHQRFPAGSDQE